jgi:anti-anti-sigma factor
MLRIERDEDTDGRVVIRLYGRIGGQWVPELKRVCDGVMTTEGRSLCLDLNEVTFIDQAGLALLRDMQSHVAITRLSLFAAELLKPTSRDRETS